LKASTDANGNLFEPDLHITVERDKALFVRLDVTAPFLGKLRTELTSPDFQVYAGSEYVIRSSFHASLLRDDKPAGKSFDLADFDEILRRYPIVERMFTGNSSTVTDEEWKEYVDNIRWTLLLTSQTGEKMRFPLYE
jgi:hypothetical protein